MQNININLTNDLRVPDTGGLSQGDNNAIIIFSIIGPILLAASLIVLVAFLSKKKHYVYSDNQTFNLRKITKTKFFSILGLVTTLTLFGILNNQQTESETASAAAQNALSVTVDAFNLDVVPDKAGAFAYASNRIKVSTPTNTGYILTAHTSTPDLVLDSDKTQKITSVLTANNNPSTLGANTWGVATTKPTSKNDAVWRALPTSEKTAIQLKKTNNATKDDATEIFFGVNVNTDLALGTYSGTVNYVVVANLPDCPAYGTCFNDNGADNPGSMAIRYHGSADQELRLWAPNYKRAGYGFAGWNTKADGSGISYGPNATIPITADQFRDKGLNLYAMWIPSAGNLQNWTGCPALKKGEVTALTDIRDQQVYAVAKLADGKCWMIENLRLNNSASHNSDGTLAQGYNPSFIGLANPEPASSFKDTATPNSLYGTDNSTPIVISGIEPAFRFPRYNNMNTVSLVSKMTHPEQAVYSYGNYYTWTAAVADTGPYDYEHHFNTDVTSTSICPTNWRLPISSIQGRVTENDFLSLIIATSDAQPGYDANSVPIYDVSQDKNTAIKASKALRNYPNNFTYSGSLKDGNINYRGSYGSYWSSTIRGAKEASSLGFYDESVYPANGNDKTGGRSIRCMISS